MFPHGADDITWNPVVLAWGIGCFLVVFWAMCEWWRHKTAKPPSERTTKRFRRDLL